MPDDLVLKQTNSEDPDYHMLASRLDRDLHERYGEMQKAYDVHNVLKHIPDVIVLYRNGIPSACGAFKAFDAHSVELKRIFVSEDCRGKGFAQLVIKELEELARKKGYTRAILETGFGQPEAIYLYRKMGYQAIENFEPYVGNKDSLCMGKALV
ncbi:MAG: GNAT family N-acetyltransferase [Clostridia bacterium]|nr:GNAT family N-acetyltransferase [Clostridia bacterium]